jgi:hypothetical protein
VLWIGKRKVQSYRKSFFAIPIIKLNHDDDQKDIKEGERKGEKRKSN